MNTRGLPLLVAVSSSTLAVAPAFAQRVDYDALQQAIGEPVTTSVTGKPQRASELPASTIIITRDDIARSPARDVPGLLKTYAGIDVNRWTAGQSDVAVRGGVQTYNSRLLVLVDGRQVYLDHYGMTNWNLLGVQLEEIQQIELVRGPASALFGFNAASGVVNIITRQVADTASVDATAETGNHGIGHLGGSLRLPLSSGVGLKLTGATRHEDERRIPSQLLVTEAVRRVRSDQLGGELTGSFGHTDARIGGTYTRNRQAEYLPSQILTNFRYENRDLHGVVAHDTDWGGLSLNAYVNWLDLGTGTVAGGDQTGGKTITALDLSNRIVVTSASSLIRLADDNVLRIGMEYRNNTVRSNLQFSEQLSYDVAAANAMLDLRLNDRASLTMAGRIDRLWLHQSGAITQPSYDDPRTFDRSFTRGSFNVALLVRTGEAGQLRINGGYGYQLPSLINFGIRIPVISLTPLPLPLLILGSPRTDPVSVSSGEIAYSQTLDGITMEVTAFATRTNDVIGTPGDGIETTFTPLPSPALISRLRAIGDFVNYGAELSASGTPGAFTWRANYTWTHTDQSLPSIATPIAVAFSPRSTTPEHKANVVLGYQAGRLQLSANARYTSHTRQFAFSTAPQLILFHVDDAVAVDARVGFRLLPAVELFAAGENLTLANGAALSPIPADRRVRVGVGLTL